MAEPIRILFREGWYLLDLRPLAEGEQYLERVRHCSPTVTVHIECFHKEGRRRMVTHTEQVNQR